MPNERLAAHIEMYHTSMGFQPEKHMTGEELNRKYWELCGYKFWKLGPAYLNRIVMQKANAVAWKDVPPLHLDANLAIAEARKKHPLWSCTCLDGQFEFWVGGSCGRGLTFGEALLDFEIQDMIAAVGK